MQDTSLAHGVSFQSDGYAGIALSRPENAGGEQDDFRGNRLLFNGFPDLSSGEKSDLLSIAGDNGSADRPDPIFLSSQSNPSPSISSISVYSRIDPPERFNFWTTHGTYYLRAGIPHARLGSFTPLGIAVSDIRTGSVDHSPFFNCRDV